MDPNPDPVYNVVGDNMVVIKASGDGVIAPPLLGKEVHSDDNNVQITSEHEVEETDPEKVNSDPDRMQPLQDDDRHQLKESDDKRGGLENDGNKEVTWKNRGKAKEGDGYPAAQTQTKNCCDKEGHICFDCFPIPDALLKQLHHQTGMSKLMCLQTVQTVVKFYKQDLVCSKYFAYETTDDALSDYSHTEEGVGGDESALLFRATPTPIRRRREREHKQHERREEVTVKQGPPQSKRFTFANENAASSEAEFEFAPVVTTRPSLKLCGADKFRSLARRLKLESGDRSWSDAKNVSFVFTFFRKLNKVVVTLDKSLLKKLMLEDDFEFLRKVANLLRKENRWSIQWEILGILGTVAARDSRSRKCLLDSEFSVYLSRVLLNPTTDSPKISAFAELLTVLFTGGKVLPVYLMDHFGENFIMSIMDIIEDDDSRPGWALPAVLVKLLLAYNLQFAQNDIYNNITILAIAQSGPCKTLTSRLIDWLDQKDAPLTNSWEVNVSVHQCVIKMTTDIFLCRTTSHIFSVAQSVMLMRLLTKGLSNFVAGDQRRTSYLKLIQIILRHCKYDYIRNTPCLDNLEDILCEKSELSLQDQGLIRSIFREFPQLQLQQELYKYF